MRVRAAFYCLTIGLLFTLMLGWTEVQGAEIPTPEALMAKYGLHPGLQITKENAHLIKDLVPEAFYRRTLAGELIFTIGQFKSPDVLTKVWHEEYYQARERNTGKYTVDVDGGIIDATGQRPWPMPYGLPFPTIDLAEDPKKIGAKIQWNAFSVLGTWDDFAVIGAFPLASMAINAKTPDRYGLLRTARQFVDFRRTPLEINRPVSWQDLFFFLAPSDAFGTATLTWRWKDPKQWDSVWAYSPSVRRIRRVTAANRSDPSLGTELVQDDTNLYAGKIEMFEWKYVGMQAMLMPFYRLEGQAPDDYVVRQPMQTEHAGHPYQHVPNAHQITNREWKFGFQETPQRYASWWPYTQLWIPVWAYVVEGFPKDPYYNFGRQIFWFEANTFAGVWKQSYDRSGEYWRTAYITPEWHLCDKGEGKPFIVFDTNSAIIVDEKTNRATLGCATNNHELIPGGDARRAWNVGLDPDLFTLGRFLEYGK